LAVGIELLKRKASRSVPLVFLGGAPEKVERTRQLLPGAAYLGWEAKDRDLRRAIDAATPCKAPPGARSGAMAQYAKSPLRKKLGIDENTAVLTMARPGMSARFWASKPKVRPAIAFYCSCVRATN
jgi:hypothetical protein